MIHLSLDTNRFKDFSKLVGATGSFATAVDASKKGNNLVERATFGKSGYALGVAVTTASKLYALNAMVAAPNLNNLRTYAFRHSTYIVESVGGAVLSDYLHRFNR